LINDRPGSSLENGERPAGGKSVKDPITQFTYPSGWIDACHDPGGLEAVARGLAVLCSSGKVLYRGYTTGTTAAAACKAAVLSLRSPVAEVTINLPSGIAVEVELQGRDGKGVCHKYSGDYPEDVTAGCEMVAAARPSTCVRVVAGKGIGRFVRDTPRYPLGAPAISPSARELMLRSIQEALDKIEERGATIELMVMAGRGDCQQRPSFKGGGGGGLSILGTNRTWSNTGTINNGIEPGEGLSIVPGGADHGSAGAVPLPSPVP
jgi:cobalt-precorrin-5B (C1)-methyltransferase